MVAQQPIHQMIFLLYTGTSALTIYISNMQRTEKYSAVVYYPSTRLSVVPSIHQSHCLRRLFFSRLNFPQLISRFFPRQNSIISIARLSYSFRIFCLETKFYDSGTLRIYPPTRTLLYLFLCWNDPEVFNTKSQLQIQRSSRWATAYPPTQISAFLGQTTHE